MKFVALTLTLLLWTVSAGHSLTIPQRIVCNTEEDAQRLAQALQYSITYGNTVFQKLQTEDRCTLGHEVEVDPQDRTDSDATSTASTIPIYPVTYKKDGKTLTGFTPIEWLNQETY